MILEVQPGYFINLAHVTCVIEQSFPSYQVEVRPMDENPQTFMHEDAVRFSDTYSRYIRHINSQHPSPQSLIHPEREKLWEGLSDDFQRNYMSV